MPRRKKPKHNESQALLNNSVYAVKGSKRRRGSKKAEIRGNAKQTKQTRVAIENGLKMAQIEAYAKEHNVTIAQAMIHFM
ncbi:hypothetical protein [Vreelandella sulfidaeris]